MSLGLNKSLSRATDNPIVKMIIDKNEGFIRRHLVLSPTLISNLAEVGVISGVAKTEMRTETNNEQVTRLLGILRHRSMDNFKRFLQLLRNSLYGWLVDGILDTQMHQSKLMDNMLQYSTFREYLIKNAATYDSDYSDLRDVGKEDTSPYRYPVMPRHSYDHQSSEYDSSYRASFPRNVYGLHADFRSQRVETEHALRMLRQEERAIKDLLYQNSREQDLLYRNHHMLYDIDRRLQLIQNDAGQLIRPSPNAEHARQRLYRLQRVLWEGK